MRPRASGLLALATLGLLLLSTSSTAYATLAAYIALVALGAGWQTLTRLEPLRFGTGTWLLWGLAVVACLTLLVFPETADRLGDFFGITLVRKLDSLSGIERGSWNLQAWTNFLDVHGIGVGLGSARASSFVLVLLSNVGVLGTALFAAFLARVLIAPARAPEDDDAGDAPVRRAARHAVLAGVIAATVSGVVFDLGLAFYAFAAAAVASRPSPRPSTRSELAHGHA